MRQLTKDQGEGHVISEYLGKQRITPEIKSHGLKSGDKILVSSDGLHKFVDRNDISRLMASDMTGQQIAGALVKLAKENGSNDNITVQVYSHP